MESPTPPPVADTSADAEKLPSASPAPFLKALKPPRAAASVEGSAPPSSASPATTASAASGRVSPPASAEDLDDLAEAPSPDESFESATTVVPRAALAHRDVDRDTEAASLAALKPPPALEDMVAKIPAETRNALEEIFRARFRTVRRITPEQLR